LALSTYLPLSATLEKERSAAARDLPIFMAHGLYDEVIPMARAEQSRKTLEDLGYPLQWRSYPMPHSVCAAEVADLAGFLVRVLGS
jgi:phospholipase/carboxylesterase